jgi:hypothetical protein
MKADLLKYSFLLVFFFLAQSSFAQRETKSAMDSVVIKERDGKYYLIASATLHGIGQGVYISTLFTDTVFTRGSSGFDYKIEKTNFGKSFPYITAIAGFTSTLILTKNKWINPAAANTHFWGSTAGYLHGMALYWTINDDFVIEKGKSILVPAGLFSLAEGWVGYYIAKKHKIDHARSIAWNSGNIWGMTSGFLLNNSFSDSQDARKTGIAMLGGSALGIAGAHLLQNHLPRSSGDWRAVNAGGFVGSLFGLSVVDVLRNEKQVYNTVLITSTLGLCASYMLTKNTSFTKSEGAVITIGTGVGTFLGLGVSYLADTEMPVGMLMTGTGAALGWAITYTALKLETKNKTKNMKLEKDRSGSLNFQINPTGFSMLKMSEAQQIRLMQQNISAGMAGVTLSW